jgi:hypothetical protein
VGTPAAPVWRDMKSATFVVEVEEMANEYVPGPLTTALALRFT